jgi:hypothetical protein
MLSNLAFKFNLRLSATALHAAADHNQGRCLQLLLRRGAAPDRYGLPDHARHVIYRMPNPRCLSPMASYDVVSCDAVSHDMVSHDAASYDFADFQGTSNGGRQFLKNRRSNRHIVPLYGKSDRLCTQGRKFAHC